MPTFDPFTFAYIEAMFFTGIETDDHGDDTERSKALTIADLASETLSQIKADCAGFQALHANDINGNESQAGHDFWFTRNGHGVGFWDGDWPEPAATLMTNTSKQFGEVNPYIGDDGKVYLS